MARLLSNLLFWLLMIPIALGSLVFVVVAYLPFVALKAIWLAITGRLDRATGEPRAASGRPPPVHPG